jgi:hypothetical protein
LISEIALLVLLLLYFAIFVGVGLGKGWKYLGSDVQGKDDKDYLPKFQEFSLSLAGLAVTAIALFVSIKFGGTFSSLENFTAIILFFSISFVTLSLSWNLSRFSKGTYHFLSGVLSDMGVLSIGCGFLIFFYRISPLSYLPFFAIPLAFGFFILFFIILAALDLRRKIVFWSSSEKKPSENEEKKP